MATHARVVQGSAAWFEMAGTLMSEAAAQALLPSTLNISLVERYTDGAEVAEGLVQGIRLDIKDGRFSFRVGARPDERADILNEISVAAARTLNLMHSADPAFENVRDQLLRSGAMRIEGDPSRLGAWFEAVHDLIVDRTC